MRYSFFSSKTSTREGNVVGREKLCSVPEGSKGAKLVLLSAGEGFFDADDAASVGPAPSLITQYIYTCRPGYKCNKMLTKLQSTVFSNVLAPEDADISLLC